MDNENQPLYLKIYNDLITGIKSGKYREGDRIPSEKELAEEFRVSRITSKKALEKLAGDGIITRQPGRGSFVADSSLAINLVADRPGPAGNKLFGLVIADFSESYGTGLLSGIEHETNQNGCYFILRRSYGRQNEEEMIIESLLEFGVDGLIIMPVHDEHYSLKILRLVLDKFPMVLIDRNLQNIPAAFVGSDNVVAAQKATDYLLNLGHRAISFLSPPATGASTISERIDGFMKSHAEHGVAVDQSLWITDLISTIPDHYSLETLAQDKERIVSLLEKNPEITCLFAVEYNIALIALDAIKELGKKVPDDISILCFDGPDNYTRDYFFTHIRQREEEMGQTAVQLLLKQIKGQEISNKIFLETDLIIGHSTRSI